MTWPAPGSHGLDGSSPSWWSPSRSTSPRSAPAAKPCPAPWAHRTLHPVAGPCVVGASVGLVWHLVQTVTAELAERAELRALTDLTATDDSPRAMDHWRFHAGRCRQRRPAEAESGPPVTRTHDATSRALKEHPGKRSMSTAPNTPTPYRDDATAAIRARALLDFHRGT